METTRWNPTIVKYTWQTLPVTWGTNANANSVSGIRSADFRRPKAIVKGDPFGFTVLRRRGDRMGIDGEELLWKSGAKKARVLIKRRINFGYRFTVDIRTYSWFEPRATKTTDGRTETRATHAHTHKTLTRPMRNNRWATTTVVGRRCIGERTGPPAHRRPPVVRRPGRTAERQRSLPAGGIFEPSNSKTAARTLAAFSSRFLFALGRPNKPAATKRNQGDWSTVATK